MCGRYGFVPPHNFFDRFEITNRNEFDLAPNYNTTPGQIMPVISMNSPKTVRLMKWGLVPFWANDPRIGYKMINARAEGIEAKPSFRGPFKNKRCLIPASGFFERSHYFKLKGKEIFSFAGLFDIWKDGQGKEVKTYTIITTRANELVSKIHDRMPVILKKEDEDLWADNSACETEKLLALLTPFSSGGIECVREE